VVAGHATSRRYALVYFMACTPCLSGGKVYFSGIGGQQVQWDVLGDVMVLFRGSAGMIIPYNMYLEFVTEGYF
jgi:hypothetical protein